MVGVISGPVIIYDKSAIRALSKSDIDMLSHTFYTVVTPILVWEICGEIDKANSGQSTTKMLESLSGKSSPFHCTSTMEWRQMCLAELLLEQRFPIAEPIDRKPVIEGAHRVPLKSGGYVTHIDQDPEINALRMMSVGEYPKQYNKYAKLWHAHKKSIDLARFKSKLPLKGVKAETMEQVKGRASLMLADESLRPGLIAILLDAVVKNENHKKLILKYWLRHQSTWPELCPFCSDCSRTLLTFHIAQSGGLLNQDPSNTLDSEYLMYLPRCTVFVSNDLKSHGKLAPILVKPDQMYLDVRSLKADIATYKLSDTECMPLMKSCYRLWSRREPPEWPPRNLFKDSAKGNRKADSKPSLDPLEMIEEVQQEIDENPAKYPKRRPWPL